MSRGIPTINEGVFAKCQVNTPPNIACRMLDMAGYTYDLMGKPILEISFGDGSLLAPIVHRYIKDGLRSNRTIEEIRLGLHEDIVGYEIDEALVYQTRLRLDAIAKQYGIDEVSWNLNNEDSLHIDIANKYKFIIGNPPYLESKAMRPEVRDWLRKTFESCKRGKFDYCYAFLEKGLSLLDEDGVMVQLVPSSILSILSARLLRNMLLDGVTEITSFQSGNVFEHVLVSPCVIRYEKGADSNRITMSDWEGSSQDYPKAKENEDWTSVYADANLQGRRFGDKYVASMPVATLCNDAFLLREDEDTEEALVRKAACPRQLKAGTKLNIIFPYLVDDDGTIRRIDSGAFEETFPRTAEHLSHYRTRLEQRKSDLRAEWFEYGRSQGIAHIDDGTRLMLSTVISNRVYVYEIPKGVVPYGGIVISPKQGASLEHAKDVLKSDEFLSYARTVGTKVSGSSVRITSRHINDYRYTDHEDTGHGAEASDI